MAYKKAVKEAVQYNTEMYMARLVLKNPMIHFAVLTICLYTVFRTILSIVSMMSGGNVVIALLSVAGLIVLAICSVCSLFFSRDGGDRLVSMLTFSCVALITLCAASVMECLFLKLDAQTVFQTVFLIAAVLTSVSLRSAAIGKSAQTAGGYMLGFVGLAALAFSAIALVSVWSALRGCFADSYNWSFLQEDIDISTKEMKWYFLDSKITGTMVGTLFYTRFMERIAYLLMLASIAFAALKMSPYINSEKRTVEFAQDAGGYTAYDGADFRTISKKRASENIRSQSYYGIGSLDRGDEDNFEDDFEPSRQSNANEYGDYLDEETGIFYYYDDRTGRYYYLDESRGEYVYKRENRTKPVNPSDAMPWELSPSEDEEDNIYNY